MVELTVTWEDKLGISHKLKKAKYQDFINIFIIRGWSATVFPIKVSAVVS